MKNIFIILVVLITFSHAEVDYSKFISKNKCDQILDYDTYSICYSYRHKGALFGWTTLYGEKVHKKNIKKRPDFWTDKRIPEKYRTYYNDYTGMGYKYNRGHFAARDADFDYNIKDLESTYSMANILPQAANVNQKTWTKVESYGSSLASKLGKIDSISIAIYKNVNKKLKNEIIIPSGFIRIYKNKDFNLEKCFYYENNLYVNYKEDKLKNHEINCNNVKDML